MRALLSLLLALPAAALAKDDPLAGRIAGEPVDCIQLSQVDGPTIVDDHTILYQRTGRRIWRTGPIGTCPALRPMNTLIVRVWGGQLCRNDQFQVLEPGAAIPSRICRFDRFVPYDKPK